jgi:hypothetical protein
LTRGGGEEPKKVIPTEAPDAEEAQADASDHAGSDDAASKEMALLSQGKRDRDLKRESDEAEHDRGQAFKNHFETLSIWMLDVLFAGFVLISTIWVLHLVLPENSMGVGWVSYLHGWLSKDQLDKITGVLAGGAIAGLVADHFKRRMGS